MNGERESQLIEMVQRATEPAAVSDDDRLCVCANDAAHRLFGVEPGTLIGRKFSEFAVPDTNWDSVWQEFLRVGTFAADWQILRADGETADIEVFSVANIVPGRHLTMIRDMRDRKRTENLLRASDEHYARIFHGNPAAIAVLTFPECVYRDINRSFIETTGYWRAELIGRRMSESGALLEAEDMERLHERLEQEGIMRGILLRLRTKQGELRDAVGSFAVTEIHGERSLIATFTGIAEQFRLER